MKTAIDMSKGEGRRIVIYQAGFSMLLTLALVALPLRAQQGGSEDEGAVAMGSQGRMVRGAVTATAADRLTVKTDAGDTFQVIVTTNTRVMKERQPLKLADVHVGDGLGAMGVIDPATRTVHAAMVFVVDAAQVKKMKEDMGKTFISGKIVAIDIDDLELTIHRQDGVTQKIAVDEGTSFRRGGRREGAMMRGDGSAEASFGPGAGAGSGGGARAGAGQGGESITLADVKVGDMVIGPGALKAGTFVPTQLTVIDAAIMGRRRRSEGSDSALPAAGTAPAAASASGTTPH